MPFSSSSPKGEAAARLARRLAWLPSMVWKNRALVFGCVALVLALYGQKLIVDELTRGMAVRLYAAAIIVMIVAWRATYQDRSFLSPAPVAPADVGASVKRIIGVPRAPLGGASTLRYWLVLAALCVNVFSTVWLRAHAYVSYLGGLGWLVSLVILLVVFVGHRSHVPEAASGAVDVEKRTDLHFPRELEIAICLGIFSLALVLRLHRLGDWTSGMHGDEGEVGLDALRILEGDRVSPFLAGWFEQPNFYYWGVALGMSVFGTGLGGLRSFSCLVGALMILPFYLLVREWFGMRMAIVASLFLAISDVAIHFSRQEFSNITTPFFLVIGFFFFFRGLSVGRTLHFILAGYAHMLSMYFYLGGRLTPILLAVFLGYLFALMPLVGVLSAYRDLRSRMPRLGRWQAGRRATLLQAARVLPYLRHCVPAYIVACFCFATPWLAYYADHRDLWNARVKDKIIFSHPERMIAQYGVTHDPIYLGLRFPKENDPLPLPITLERSPISVLVARDGFWPRVVWRQIRTTVSILTYHFDASSVYTFTMEPVAKPIEAALVILGIAWALWRWRDTRMALLSIWFWSTVLVGGALTIDAPYMARLIGILPVMAVFAAAPVNKLVAEFVKAMGGFRRSALWTRIAQGVSAAALLGLLGYLTWQNYSDYYLRYLARRPFREGTGQAYFVREMNRDVAAEGRPQPEYYSLGAHYIYWGYGPNRFLNYRTSGQDMANPSNQLPITDDGDRDIVFMIWPVNQHYLPVIKAYYPGGIETPFSYGPAGESQPLFTSYRVKKEQLDARRVFLTTYTPARGRAIHREVGALGSSETPLPGELVYPVEVRWEGALIAPAYGIYRFQIEAAGVSTLIIDGSRILTTGRRKTAESSVLLARGPHQVILRGALPRSEDRVDLRWAAGDGALETIARRFLWAGPGRALAGEIRPLADDPFEKRGNGMDRRPAVQRRIDGFLGFRDAPSAMGDGTPLLGVWTGKLSVTVGGSYRFHIFSNGDSTISIDGRLVVDNRHGGHSPREADGRADLNAGTHQFELRYNWTGEVGYLEVFWTPPGGERSMLGPGSLLAEGGLWTPGDMNAPKIEAGLLGNEPRTRLLDTSLAVSPLEHPRGCALDAHGNLYVADTERHRLVIFNANGELVRTWGREGRGPGEFITPEDVAVGPDGRIYVLDSSLARVEIFTPEGRLDQVLNDVGCAPAGFGVGLDGMVYVADTCGNGVRKYRPSGELAAVFRGGSSPADRLEQPVDVAVGRDGAIFVADLRDRIVKFDPASDRIEKTWSAHIGRSFGAANLILEGRVLYLTDPDRNGITTIDTVSGGAGITDKNVLRTAQCMIQNVAGTLP